MSRLLRFIPEGGSLVEVTCRTIHSRLLFRPGHPLNEIIIGALARSKRLYGIRIICYSFLSSHFHLLLLGEEELKGYWFDRTQEYAARHRREDFEPLKYATPEELTLDPLPCWRHLTEEERRRRVAALVAEIEAQTAAQRESTGIPSLGPAAILAQDPHSRPLHSKKSPAPFCHAASKAWRELLWAAYAEFVAAFRRAAERLKEVELSVRFPQGSFPPPLPFVGG